MIATRPAWAWATLAVSLAGANACQEPDPGLTEALEAVTPALLKSHVRFLSDDLLRGRDTNDRGFEIAKEYVASQFGRMGLVPLDGSSYLQPFDLLEAVADLGSELTVADLRLREPEARFEPAWLEGSASWTGEGVYVGYGLATHGRDDYAGADVSGKAVFLLRGEPDDWASDRNRARASNASVEIAVRRGASVIIQLSAPRDPGVVRSPSPPGNPRRVLALADGTSPRVRAHATVAAEGSWRLLEAWGVDPGEATAIADVGESPALPVGQVSLTRTHRLEPVRSWNVVGIVPGTDPAHRDESIVFTAHLDHVGIGPPNSEGDSINNGAHDNAIGTAKLMASAEAMVRLQPRRSIVFAAVGAEERGLLGSWYYVRNPAFPIEGVVANINQDGGREGVTTEDVIDNAADLSDMNRIVRAVLADVGVGVMDRDRALTSLVGFSSDHYPFLLAGVPAIDLKPGHTVDGDLQIGLADRLKYYDEWRHRPADNFNEQTFTMESTAEMAKRAVLLAWHLSEMDGMPAMDPEHPIYRERATPSEPYYFGPGYRFGKQFPIRSRHESQTDQLKGFPMRYVSLSPTLLLAFAFGLGHTGSGPGGLGPTAAAGQASADYRLLDTSTYLEMETIGGLQISPDGRHVLFTRGWIDKMEDRTRSNLWIAETDGSRVRQLTNGTWSDFSPAWSPDGERIAFLSDRDGSTQIHVMWLDTRESAQLTHLEQTPGALKWSPDGETLAFGMRVPETTPILPVSLPEYPRGANLAPPAKVIDRIIFGYDGRGDLPRGDIHVFTLDAQSGGTPRQVTPEGHSYNDPRGFAAEVHWSRDGEKLYFVAWLEPWSEVELEINESEIYSMDLSSGDIEQLTDRQGPDRGMQLSPDGEWIAYTGFDDQDYADGNISSLYLMDSSGGSKRLLAGDLPNSVRSVLWAPDNSGVYYLMSERGVAHVYFVSRDGERRPVTTGNHVLSQLTLAANGQAAAVRSTTDRPGYLVTFPMMPGASAASPDEMSTLVDVNADVLDGVRLGQVDELLFESPDGLDLQGWLMKPAEFDASRKYPLLLWIHGGPYSMYSVQWNWAWQNFAAEGYAVFFMNPRGSTGYGKAFVDGIKHSYPGKDYDDLMAGVDAAMAEGFIDPDNLFVLGGSGGGILTAYIVGQTHRFQAAAAMRPIVNYISAAGTADDPTDKYSWFMKPHWEDPLDWYERSPIASVGNVETPVLLMTGERDLRTPMGQSEEFFRALKMQGKETLLIRMPEEFHGWRRPSHRISGQLYLQAWFEKYRKRVPAS